MSVLLATFSSISCLNVSMQRNIDQCLKGIYRLGYVNALLTTVESQEPYFYFGLSLTAMMKDGLGICVISNDV